MTLLRRPLSDDFGHRTLGSPAASQARVTQGAKAEAVKETGFPMRGKTIKATILGAGALALMAGTAIAADMPVYTKAPPPVLGGSVANASPTRPISRWALNKLREGIPDCLTNRRALSESIPRASSSRFR